MSKPTDSILKNYINSVATLNLVLDKGRHIDEAIRQVAAPGPHLRAIVSGVIRHLETLAPWVKSKVKLKPKDKPLAYLMMCAAFQHQWMENCKRSDLIYQAAEATVKLNRAWAKGMVYATLKQLNQAPIERQRNLPTWLDEKIQQSHGKKQADKLLHIWGTPPDTCCLRITTDGNENQVADIVKESEPCQTYRETGSRHAPLSNVTAMCTLAPNHLYIQDCIHQDIIAQLPTLPEKAIVLDACAAPGGKSTALLNRQPNIRLLATDNKNKRMRRLQDNLANYPQARCQQADACHPERWWDKQPFDLILCDAPCSGTGTLHKNPEIKVHQSPDNIKALCKQQLQLLQALWPLVKVGGYLLYSTCSILDEENQQIITSFTNNIHTTQIQTIEKYYLPDGIHGGGYCALMHKLS